MAQQIDIIANIITKVDGAEAGINRLKNGLSKLKLPDGLDKNLTKSFANLDGIFERYRNQLNKGFKTKGDVSAFAKTGKELEAELDRVSKYMTELTGKKIDFKVNSEPIKQAQKDLANLIEQQQQLSNKALNFKVEGANGQSIQSLLEGIRKTAGDTKAGRAANSAIANLQMGDAASAKANIETIIASLDRLKKAKQDAEVVAGTGLNMAGAANAIKAQLDTATSGLQKVKADADAAKASLEQMQGKQLADAGDKANKLAKDLLQVQSSMNQANKSAQDFANSSFRMANQLDQLKSSTQYFFGLRNMINLLKQGFREALNTVKELDAAMTETAVVTKFDVGDMWEKLPEYTANANALGATVQDMYKSATLYYQQGLNAQQAMSIASETMKMARIGGLEAADATDMMTAALRGFNMELSSESAQRINDVYSNLAAKTASNTQELGEAMERTASIAHSAGMSFEGTSAFLAQMIETTREAPENLGTAMKTIIARFQELKKNPLEMEEVDGEEVSFNKVDTALQSIGVTLRDTNGQFRELDQVFLDIASRWDGLSQTQQRYIATTAAGSRQQSRFIAMMNNYDRTVQLMDYANNSTGASNEQFGKTMESLEAKLNKLKNAWDLFRMGLADNSMIKGAVDGLTKFVNTVTKLIDTLSFGSGKIKSALTIFTAFMGLRMAGRGINALLGGLGGMLDPNSSILKGAFGGGLIGSQRGNAAVQAKLINQPIVNVLNQILGAVRTGKTGAQDSGTRADYKKSLNDFRSIANKPGAKISDTLGTLKGLDGQQMRLISKSNVGTMRQLQRSMAGTDMGKVLAAQTITAMKRGSITGNQLAGMNKANIGTILGTKEAQAYSESFARNVQKNILPKWQETQQVVSEKIRSQAKYSDPALSAGMTDAQGKPLSHLDLISKTKLNQQTGEVEQNPYYNPKYVEKFKEMTKAEREAIKQQAALGEGAMQQKTPLEKIQQSLSHIGGSAITAGQGLMSLGATLNSMGFEAAGAAVTSFGSALSNLGMIANGLPAMLSILSNPFGAIAAIAGGLIGIVTAVSNSHIKQIKEDAKKVTDSFKQTQDETSKNIESVKAWKEEMATLSKGVDANGLNVNLSDVDYAHYLEIVDSIAKMNPDIVKGYTAQGHAIIDNNTALDETLTKLQEIQDKATEDYLDADKGLQKLIDARNIDKEFVKANTMQTSASRTTRTDITPNVQVRAAAPLASDVMSLASQLENQKGLDAASVLKTYNINLEELKSGEQSAINRFVQFQDKINADVSKAVASSTEDLNEGVSEGFSKLSDSTAAFDESIQPVLQNLQTYAANLPGFDNIGDEFQSAINMGLKDIAILPDLDATQMQEQVRNLIQQFDDLTYEDSAYATAMEEVEAAQDQFASSLDVSEYAKNTENALTTLNNLLEQYEGDTTAYGQAVTEYLTNQIARIKKFTEEGTVSLTEALNTATTDIAAAEGAYQAFQDATKTDMSTGADNMKSIFDEITKDTEGVQLHMQGKGDNTLWKGMEAMFSEDAIQKAAKKGPEAVQSMLNRIKPMLQEGQAGFDAFWNDMFSDENVAKLEQIKGVMIDQENGEITWDDDINPDVFHEMAEQLGYADQYLASMLNKGRQFADIDFMDTSDVRKALSTDNAAIKGTSTTTITDVQGKTETVSDLFVKEDYLKNALRDSGLSNPVEIKNAIDNMTKNGVKIIPNPNDMTKKDFKNMGITDIPSLVRTLGDTGQFNRSEIEEYAQHMKDYNAGEFETLYQDYLDSQEHPELPSINSIDNNVASIASMIAQNHGIADQATKDAYKEDSKLVYGENGKGGNPDSLGEFFAKGQNKFGQNLTADEYKVTKKTLENLAAAEESRKTFYETQAKKATQEGRTEDADWFNKAAKNTQKKIDYLTENLEDGAKAYKKAKENEKKETEEGKEGYLPSSAKAAKDKAERESKERAEREQWQHSKENYEQQAQNTFKPTKSLEQQKKERDAQIQWQRSKENYEQQAKNASSPTKSLNQQKGDAIKQAYNFGLNNTKEIGEQYIAGIADFAVNQTESSIIAQQAGEKAAENTNKNYQQGYDTFTTEDIMAGKVVGGRNITTSRNNAIDLLGSALKSAWDSLSEVEGSIPSQDTSFAAKVTSSAQKLGEALKNGWNALQNNTPSEPATQSVPTINQGTSTVANVAQEVVQKVTTQESGLDETKQKLESINSTANKGADMKVKASSDGSLTTAENALNKLKGGAASGATIKINSGKGDAIGKAQQNAAKGAEMPLKIRDLATSTINKINANARKPVNKTVNISPNYTGTWRKEVYISKTGPGANAYTGVNNKISFHHVPMAGSLARGTKKGRVGPRNQGGLTLTGEKGYEIAWIPSESRSAILGASGPEMVNLPKEAVVYNHDQSKEIMKKRKNIPAGSMDSGSASYKPGGSSSSTTTTTTIRRSTGSTISKTVKDTGDKVAKDTENATEKVARVSVWWENIARRTESTQQKMDNNAKEFEKYIKNINATLTSTGTIGKGNDYIQNIKDYINLNAEQVGRASKELTQLDTGTGKNSEKKGAQKKLKSKYKKGNVNIAEISYENDKGKSKKKFVNLAPYIKKDKVTGALQVDENALKKISNVNKRKAVAEAANKEIDDRTSKKTKAEDAIQKAQEALEKMGQDLYETFFKWETELTKIWNITQKIEAAEARAAEAKEGSSLLEAKLASGRAKADKDFAQQSIDMYKSELNSEVKALEQRAASVKEKQDALNRAINIDDEINQLNSITNKLNSATAARTKADKAKQTLDSKQAQLNKKQKELNEAKKNKKVINKTKKNKNGESGAITYTVFNTQLINKLEKEVKQLEGEVKTAKQTYNTAQNATMKDTDHLGYETYAQQLQQDIKAQQTASKYTTITRMGDGTVEVQVDTQSLMNAKDAGQITEAEAKRIEDYVKNIQDSNKDLQDTYKDITSGMTELYSRLDTLQKDWTDYADQLWDISDKEEQERINELKDLSNSISNAMKKLLDDVKKKLDERRQQEDNAKTEAEISQKQQRLTMLRADTSGGHAVEIAQLEQELADARQNYERSLEDQLLEKLQNQADVAQEQRERMIELEEGIKDAVNNAALVNEWMAAAQQASLQDDPAILEKYREQMYNAYMAANEADKKPEVLRQSLETSFNTLYNGLLTNQAEQEAVKTQLNALEGTEADIKDAKSLLGQIFEQLEKMSTEVSSQKDPNAGKGAEEAIKKSENAVNASKTTATATANKKTNAEVYKEKLAKYTSNGKLSTNELSYILSYGKQAGKSEREVVKALANTKVTWKDIITEAKKNKYSESKVRGWFSSSWSKSHKESFAKAFNSIYKPKKKMKEKYATGGLNTYTGPAWLDGTPSKPELVLNAQDTKNFIALKDVLSKAVNSTGQISDSYGNATYEININVDHLNSDYDVDKVVERVKKKIVQDSGYRNVTQVRNFR